MTDSARRILESFDRLSETEKQEAASVFHGVRCALDAPPLPDEDLESQADEIFCELDNSGGEYEA